MKKLSITSAFFAALAVFLPAGTATVHAQSTPTIVRACSSGMFAVYTDCASGKSVRQTMGSGSARYPIDADGKSFKIATVGGQGTYSMSATLSDGTLVDLGTFKAEGSVYTMSAAARQKGWRSSGLVIYAPAGGAGAPAPAPASAPGVDASKVAYPIAELGGCKNQQACASYCAGADHMVSCINYAQKSGLMSGPDLERSRRVAARVASGSTPGGCKTKESCESYCQGNVGQINECVSFAEELGVLPPEELAQVKRVAKALAGGAKMPGGCTSKKTCETYCEDASHIDECLDFAGVAEMIPANELQEARKVAKFLKNGETPGKCKTKEQCQKYCDADAHFDECIGFAEKTGFVSAEEAVMAKKVGGKGPGGCKSKNACAAYCEDPENAEECLEFATAKRLLSENEAKMAKEGPAMIREGLKSVPAEMRPEVEACLKNAMGSSMYEKVTNGVGSMTKAAGEKVKACFENSVQNYVQKMIPKGVPGGAGGGPSQEMIQNYIKKGAPPSAEEIQEMMQAGGGVPGGKAGPPAGIPGGTQGPPSAEQIQQMMKAGGAPAGMPSSPAGGQYGPPAVPDGRQAGGQYGPPAGIPMGPPQ